MADYKFDLPVDREQLEAIGMVAAEWSYLESVIDAAIWTFAHIADEDTGAAMTTHLTLPNRLGMLTTLVRLGVDNGWAAERQLSALSTICKAVEHLSKGRAEVIHGRWARGSAAHP